MFENLNKIRFLIIILVVINHLDFSPKAVSGGVVKMFHFFIESTSPLLAIFSGYLFFFGAREKFDYAQKLKRRLYSLVFPYLFWISIYIVLHCVIKSVALAVLNRPIWSSMDPSFTWKYLFNAFFADPIVPNYWYLQNLIAVLPFCYFIWRLLRCPILFYCAFGGIILVYSFNLFPIFFHQRFLPYFLIGAYLGFQKYSWNIFSSLDRFSTNLFLIITLLLPSFFEYDKGGIVLKCLLVFACAALLIESFRRGIPNILNQFLANNERHSFIVFCMHALILSVFSKLIALIMPGFLFQNFFTDLVLTIVLFACVLLVNLWISRAIEARFPAFWAFLVGFRQKSTACLPFRQDLFKPVEIISEKCWQPMPAISSQCKTDVRSRAGRPGRR